MDKNHPLRSRNCRIVMLNWSIIAFGFIGLLLPSAVWSQERFQDLYPAVSIQKNRIKKMTVELYAGLEGLDSVQIEQRAADYRENFVFDFLGRPIRYDATDINIHNQGTFGPHIVANYEYSDKGLVSHRHDSTAFGRISEWQVVHDTLGRLRSEVMMLPGASSPTIEKQYLYDSKNRLHKIKTTRSRVAEGLQAECTWLFYVYDTHSFNATSLSPMEMARCQCNLEYLDVDARTARRVVYDSTGTITQTLLMNYDRTGKPIRIESLDPSGKVLHAWVDLIYGRNGLVTVEAAGEKEISEYELARLAMAGQALVIDQWADWRLLRQVRVRLAGRETSRYVFSYELWD